MAACFAVNGSRSLRNESACNPEGNPETGGGRFSGEAPLEISEEINQSPHAGDASDPDSFGNQPHGENPSAPSSGPCGRRQRGPGST